MKRGDEFRIVRDSSFYITKTKGLFFGHKNMRLQKFIQLLEAQPKMRFKRF